MTMDTRDREFLVSRMRLTRIGVWVTLAGAGIVVGLGIYTWFRSRWLVDPIYVAEQIETGTADPTTLQLLAVMAPMLFVTCLVLAVILMLLAAWALHTERRYLKIIESLEKRN